MNKQIFTKKKSNVFLAMALFMIALFPGATGYAQTISTYAGNENYGYSGDGGQATAAEIGSPYFTALDDLGNLYISENLHFSIREITPSGIISTIAGNGTAGYSGDGGPATLAQLGSPLGGVAIYRGNLYIADNGNHVIRKVDALGIITTIAGNGTAGHTGDGGSATLAELFGPSDIKFDSAGNMYIADNGSCVRMVNSITGIISTIVGTGVSGYSGDGGPATAAKLRIVESIAFDAANNLYVSEYNISLPAFSGSESRVRKVTPQGIISTYAGNGINGYSGDNGPATAAEIKFPLGMACDAAGNLYIADKLNNVVRMVNAASGIITTVAGGNSGNFTLPNVGDGGLATAALISGPADVVFNSAGNMLISDGDNLIREVVPDCSGVTAGAITNLGNSTFCTSGSDTLTITGETYGIGITYQWLSSTDGVTWTGTGSNSIAYYTDILTTTTYYKAVITCGGSAGIHDTTQVDTISINPITPTINISANTSDTICMGTSVIFAAVPTDSGTTPSYQWTKNGIIVGTANTYTDNNLNNNDAIICQLTSNAACAIPATINSNPIIMTVNPIVTPMVSISSSSGSSICSGTNVTFTATATNSGASPSYSWTKNGIAVGNGSTYMDNNLNNNDAIACTLTSDVACAAITTATSDTITMAVTNTVTPMVSISSSPASPVCAGSTITFTAVPDGGGNNPSYQWIKNGSIVGTTVNTYVDNSLNNNDAIVCVLTSDAGCATASIATSDTLAMAVNPDVVSTVSINANTGSTICTGSVVIFTATSTGAGTNPSYHWTKNGNTVTGTGNTYTDNNLANNDAIACTLTSNAACTIPATATSDTIIMTVTPIVIPTVNITSTPAGGLICEGTNVTFTVNGTNEGTAPSYQWTDNAIAIAGATNITYSSTSLNNNDAIVCILNSNAACVMPAAVISDAITMTITPTVVPTVSVSANPGDTICNNSTVTLAATQTGGGIFPEYQWTKNGTLVPFYTDSTEIFNSADSDLVIVCALTSGAACASPITVRDTIIITVDPIVPIITISASPGDTICAGTSVIFTATPAGGGTPSFYQWTKNGITVGTNSPTYTDNSVDYNDSVACTLTSSNPCAADTTGTSNIITITPPFGAPTVAIAASPSTSVSAGTPVTFTATITNGGTPTYQWQKNGVNITGATANPYITSTLANNDVITCIAFSSLCANPDSASSNQLLMQVTEGIASVNGNANNIQIYPNPNNGTFSIEGSIANSTEAQIEVLNVIGQVVYKEIVPVANGAINKQVLLSNGNANGIYLLRITTDNGSSVIRFVVER